MPVEVDSADRRRRIGEAGVRIVREHGVAGLTVRAVAAALGGSTSLITNYVRNRTQLLDLTLETLVHQWDTQVDELTGDAGQRLRRLAEWALDWNRDTGPTVAKILVQILGENAIDAQRLATLHHELDRLRGRLIAALRAAQVPDADTAADVLYLASRGAMITSVENPGDWPAERLARAADHLARTLAAGPDSEKPWSGES
ncbi:TetR/AcrR family transcriptional regulator [Nocardia sp. 2]|uniref:TetR/AcrR family transcriptional regulator n=1 Tax=Nocardia acididurans TaxID=2802282 RepID=A0ABS1M7A6_9NOCA|nr:TetR/AcrR family transcriptional regulator [Nocardia acididurans]MBL1076527.1 TetR/AcrR family transcriptional regulator [Nocardia acididurans]